MKSYNELEVWKDSRALCGLIYKISSGFPNEEIYGLTSQIRRCSVSIPSNIAEGCGRSTPKGTLNFLYISRGSLFELETQIYIAYDLNYISVEVLENLLSKILSCKKLLNGFIKYYTGL
ncbi:four helix bundle protein [Flavobacteriaceae bacterium MAR_2010_188]|nr:four helix bundle protein [Flavobacteriaceae bacterium MAR_2010_188]